MIRLEPGLHAALRESARSASISLNELCVTTLAAFAGRIPATQGPAATVNRAAAIIGDALVGVVVFGSWVRGEHGAGSDVDMLVVTEPDVEIRRELYRMWDREPVAWNGLVVEPHFVHLPSRAATPAGIWAEVAMDGLVLFERDLQLTRRLVEIRHRIAEGRIVRRYAHGQPYWTVAA